MKTEEHLRAVKESMEVIKEAVQVGLELRQLTIGFHCSAAAVHMLELFLHQHQAIDLGKVIKHDIFASREKVERLLPEDFPDKASIIPLLVQLETKRNLLCYGKVRPKEEVEEYLRVFHSVRSFFDARKVNYYEQ